MRIKIIGDNDCARATRQLLRQAGFAVTEFLPADAVLHAPHAGYVITIEIAPSTGLPPATPPDASSTTHRSSPASKPGMALPPLEASAGLPAGVSAEAGPPPAASSGLGRILVDSVDSPLEAAVLRHITQLSAAPVVLDRPGGVVHSERELRIVIPRMLTASGDSRADEAAAVAVEFGVLRGLLDLTSPPPKSPATPAPASRTKWWRLFAILVSALFMFAGRVHADARPELKHACDSAQANAPAAKAAFVFQPLTARLKPCPSCLAL